MFSVEDFKASINQTNGLSHSYAYMVKVNRIPNTLTGDFVSNAIVDNMKFRCDAVTIPGRTITGVSNRQGTWGERKDGGAANYIDINTTFILSSNLQEREFFLSWQDIIIGKHRLERRTGSTSYESVARGWNTGYFQDVTGEIEIRKYNITAETEDDWLYSVILKNCYPQGVQPFENSWNNSEIDKLNVNWVYYYMVDKIKAEKQFSTTIKPTGFFDALVRGPQALFD